MRLDSVVADMLSFGVFLGRTELSPKLSISPQLHDLADCNLPVGESWAGEQGEENTLWM